MNRNDPGVLYEMKYTLHLMHIYDGNSLSLLVEIEKREKKRGGM